MINSQWHEKTTFCLEVLAELVNAEIARPDVVTSQLFVSLISMVYDCI